MFVLGLILLILWLGFLIMLAFRNEFISKTRQKAINICYDKAIQMTHEKYKDNKTNLDIDPFIYLNKFKQYPSYNRQIFQLTKWSFDKLFPGLEEFCK